MTTWMPGMGVAWGVWHAGVLLLAPTAQEFQGRWAKVKSHAAPPPRYNHTATWLPEQRQLVVFGGRGPGRVFDDTWRLDLKTLQWSQVKTIGAPPPRAQHTATWIPEHQRLVIVGGGDLAGPLDDTWSLDPETWKWTEVKSEATPPARMMHTATWFPERQHLVIFGGAGLPDQPMDNAKPLGDTWRLDPKTWQWTLVKADATPVPRWSHTATWIPDLQQLVIVGGSGVRGAPLRDTWRLDSKTLKWIEVESDVMPPPRSYHSATWLPEQRQLVVFGGGGLGDTWRLDVHTWMWTEVESEEAPSPRWNHTATWLPEHRQLLIIGGTAGPRGPLDSIGETWRLDPSRWQWTLMENTPNPSPRAGFTVSWIPEPRMLVGFGGTGPRDALGDTWRWTVEESPPRP